MSTFGIFVIGLVIGIGIMFAKGKFIDAPANETSKKNFQREADSLSDDNEKLRKRIREAEKQIDDLMAENQKLRRLYKERDEDHDDLEDELDKAKSEIKRMRMQNEELLSKINEYQLACDSYENEIANLKKG